MAILNVASNHNKKHRGQSGHHIGYWQTEISTENQWMNAKVVWQPPEPRREAWNGFSFELKEGTNSANTSISDF